ncbi:hypothetical protein I4F81_002416 [Pyropia yezoensis]|uniref:Uncharacterized protein n=1 Tax=Pyropia yezoensis TaxID=2788 RepID=A0ACC3BPR8_PYRYE|nr:hypothetical protein I4F81_002416 [Neopyropia yezoensis]
MLLLTIGMGVVASRRGILTPPVLSALSRVVRILTPPVVASFAAVVVGAIPALRGLLIAPGGGAPLGLALAAARSLVTLASLSALKAAGVVLPPMVQLVILVEAAMPPAQNSVLMLHKEGQPATAAAVARVLLLVYVAAIVPVAVGLSIFLVVSGV